MINICVKGGLKKDRKLAEDAIWYIMDKMMPRKRNLDISFTFKKTLEDGAQGFCYGGDNDNEYIIEIDKRLSRLFGMNELIECIMHEMVHVWQGATGRMKDKFRGGYKQLWKCKDGKYRNYTNTDYEKQPWEVEAYRMQGPITKQFMKEFYPNTDTTHPLVLVYKKETA